jgi:hypothetical protein
MKSVAIRKILRLGLGADAFSASVMVWVATQLHHATLTPKDCRK